MNSNQHALQKFLDYFNTFLANSEKHIIVMDTEFNGLAFSNGASRMWRPEILEKFGNKLPPKMDDLFHNYPFKDHIKEFFNRAISTRKQQKAIGINFDRIIEFAILEFTVEPIINPETNDVIALQNTAVVPDQPFSFFRINSLIKKLQSENKALPPIDKISENSTDSLFSSREHEIVFLSLYFNTVSEIAQILSLIHNKEISHHGITKIIHRNIYPKLGVFNAKGMKEKILDLGYCQAPIVSTNLN